MSMSVDFPFPFVVTAAVMVAFVYILAYRGVVLGAVFLLVCCAIGLARQWRKAHESGAQRVVDAAHLFGPLSGLVLVLAFAPHGIWGPIAFVGPSIASSSVASTYATLTRRRASLSPAAAAAFQSSPGGEAT